MRKMLFLIDLLLHAHTKKWKAVTVQTTVETRKALILYGLVRGRAALYPLWWECCTARCFITPSKKDKMAS